MTVDTLCNHKFVALGIREHTRDSFREDLFQYTQRKNVEVQDLFFSSQKTTFVLRGSMVSIVEFLKDFAPKWNVREMGVSEFARIMEISEQHAEEWYGFCLAYEHMLMERERFESKIVAKVVKMDDTKKLKYLKEHFAGSLGDLIQNRIEFLEGKEDATSKWVNRELEKQELLKVLESSNGNIDLQTWKRVMTFIQQS